MSYILDAIRKSDQLRRRGEVPTLPGVPAAVIKRPGLMFYGLLGLILIIVGIGIGWLSPWRPARPLVADISGRSPESASARPASGQAPRMSVQAEAELSRQARPSTEAAALAAPAPRPGEAALARGERDGARSAAFSASQGTAAADSPDGQAGKDLSDGPPEPKVAARSELPQSIQQGLPPMAVAMHAYSMQPRDRLVSVDNRLLREGDYLAADLKLEQIIPDGMIFAYRGYRFRHGVK